MKTKDRFLALCLSFGLIAVLFSLVAHADPSPAPSGIPLMAVSTTVNGWSAWLNAFTTGGMIATIAGFLEIVLRVIPSQKPLSIAYALDDGLKAMGGFFNSIGNALDKILPNRISGS